MFADALSYFLPFIRSSTIDFSAVGSSVLPIPKFNISFFISLSRAVTRIVQTEPSCLIINTPVVIVGDLHGNFVDLCRILNSQGLPPDTTYLFLGDYVDRGQFSTDVVVLLFMLKATYPNNVYLLRGNHEFQSMNFYYGFYNEVFENYSKELFAAINETFTYLSYAAIIGGHTFAVHGGLSPLLNSLSDVKYISKPILDHELEKPDSLIADLIWSDPMPDDSEYTNSYRGNGKLFGKKAITKFLESTQMKRIVRAHQCVLNGYDNLFEGKVLTVFSSSAYNDNRTNKCSILKINNINQPEVVTFDTIRTITRDKAIFYPVGDTTPHCTKLHVLGQPRKVPIRASFSTVGINKHSITPTPAMRMITMKPKLVRRVSAPME